MKVTLVTVGSRGDAEPYVALGSALKRAGHDVRVATCEPFRAFVASHQLDFVPLGGDIKAIVGDEGRTALLAAGTDPIRAALALRKYVGPLVEEAHDRLDDAVAGSDVVIGHLLVPGASACAEHRGMLYLEAAHVPVSPTRAFPHPGAPPSTRPGIASFASHVIAEQVFWQAFRPCVDAFRSRVLGLGPAPLFGAPVLRRDRRPPMLFAISPHIVPPPPDWPRKTYLKGYWFLDPPQGWAPEPRLLDFLTSGEPPIYVGFGSMTAERPEELTRNVIQAVRGARRRAILSTGWGTLAAENDTEDLFFVGDVPHAWLFSRVAGAVHHGGPGTAAAAFRAGVPQMAVPFLADQPFWGHRIERLGVGPAQVPIARLTVDDLRRGVERLFDPGVKERARLLGDRIRIERGAEEIVGIVETLTEEHLRRGSFSRAGRRGLG